MIELSVCGICLEDTEDCVCKICPHCEEKVAPLHTLAGETCPDCGELIGEKSEDPFTDENAMFVQRETEDMNRHPGRM